MITASLTTRQYLEFLNEISQDKHNTLNQRVGQYFCNKFNISDDTLFYLIDNKIAMQRIHDYIKEEITNDSQSKSHS
jgi:hypothetical protein